MKTPRSILLPISVFLLIFLGSWTERKQNVYKSEFFLPGLTQEDGINIELSPKGDGYELFSRDGVQCLILAIEPSGKNMSRELSITF